MDPDKPHTDPRILRTRRLLKDALIDLLQEMDIEKITVNRIAERATINRVTFYLHYRDIPDMLERMAEDMVEDIKAALKRPPNTNSEEKLDLTCLLEHFADHAKFYKVVLGSRRTPIFTERLLKMLAGTVKFKVENASMIAKAGIEKEIAIWYGSAALIGSISSWLRNDMPYTPHYLAEQLLVLFNPSRLEVVDSDR